MSQSENLGQVTSDTAQNCKSNEEFVPKTFDQVAAELREICLRNRQLRGNATPVDQEKNNN